MSHRIRSNRRGILLALAGLALAGSTWATGPASADFGRGRVFAPGAGRGHEGSTVFGHRPAGPVEDVRMADADCSAAAAEAAAQTGGQVLSVSSRNEGGRTVCVVTVLVPGEGGQRPRKRTLTLPQ